MPTATSAVPCREYQVLHLYRHDRCKTRQQAATSDWTFSGIRMQQAQQQMKEMKGRAASLS